MKFLLNIMEKVKPHFEKGGKLSKFMPVYDGFATFLFVPGHTSNKGAHIRDGIDLKRTMFMVIVAMMPCLLFGIWNVGHQHFMALGQLTDLGEGFWDKFLFGLWKVLPLIVVSYGVGLGTEFIFCIIKKHSIQEGFLVSAMLIPLIMPVEVPLWMVAVATIFAVIIGKEVFGGTGMNILNVALTARAFLFFAYPTQMSGNKVWTNVEGGETVNGYTGETFLSQAIANGDKFYDTSGQLYETSTEILSPAFWDSFWGFIPGSIGETSAFACILGAAFLIITGIGSWRIMASGLIGGIVMGWIFNMFGPTYFPDNAYLQVHWSQQLVMGGFMFGLVFMATDPVTASQTATGKYIYGFFVGLLAILIRVVNPAYPEGMMLAILFMNVMAPLIDHYVIQSNIKKRMKRLKLAQR